MTQPKNPYPKPEWMGTKEQWYKAGLADGEKRLARALMKYMDKSYKALDFDLNGFVDIQNWLRIRAKRKK